jgi:hypothetical protein
VHIGYIWLFAVVGFFLLRMLLDPLMVRRPLLEPNLSASGLTFAMITLMIFVLSNAITQRPPRGGVEGKRNDRAAARQEAAGPGVPARNVAGYPPFLRLVDSVNQMSDSEEAPGGPSERTWLRAWAGPAIVILAHVLLVTGMILVGYCHFNNIHTGVAAAVLYLLLPYTSQMTLRLDHVAPAALLVWGVQAYRRPFFAGLLVGLAAGLSYYPLFLLPLWAGFYWRRGLIRFAIGVGVVMAALIIALALVPGGTFFAQLRQMFGWTILSQKDLIGFWEYHEPVFRIPVAAAFVALCGGLAVWPAQKNLGTLLSCSAAIMLAIQFWHPREGAMYMGWYVPLLVLTIFRPNLEDRLAISAVSEGWIRRRRSVAAKAKEPSPAAPAAEQPARAGTPAANPL